MQKYNGTQMAIYVQQLSYIKWMIQDLRFRVLSLKTIQVLTNTEISTLMKKIYITQISSHLITLAAVSWLDQVIYTCPIIHKTLMSSSTSYPSCPSCPLSWLQVFSKFTQWPDLLICLWLLWVEHFSIMLFILECPNSCLFFHGLCPVRRDW